MHSTLAALTHGSQAAVLAVPSAKQTTLFLGPDLKATQLNQNVHEDQIGCKYQLNPALCGWAFEATLACCFPDGSCQILCIQAMATATLKPMTVDQGVQYGLRGLLHRLDHLHQFRFRTEAKTFPVPDSHRESQQQTHLAE
jgi:hypothetical protein